jgi:hypothetical protein
MPASFADDHLYLILEFVGGFTIAASGTPTRQAAVLNAKEWKPAARAKSSHRQSVR